MTFSKYKKTVIACILALGIGVGGGYYFFGSPVNTQPTNVREQTKQTKPITETRNTYVVQANLKTWASCSRDYNTSISKGYF